MKIFFPFLLIAGSFGVIGALAARPDKAPAIIVCSSVVIIGIAWEFVRRERVRVWRNRPQRLCTNCLALAQPFQKENGVLYCPHCQADNPAPLESPFARDYFARQQQSA
jgi:hypothetical protein